MILAMIIHPIATAFAGVNGSWRNNSEVTTVTSGARRNMIVSVEASTYFFERNSIRANNAQIINPTHDNAIISNDRLGMENGSRTSKHTERPAAIPLYKMVNARGDVLRIASILLRRLYKIKKLVAVRARKNQFMG